MDNKPLFINQGKQDTSNDSIDFSPFEEKDVLAKVESIELNQWIKGCLDVKFKLLSGSKKDQSRKDLIPYTSQDKNSWKYRALRSCAGVPYNQNEPDNIDIRALLMNKLVTIDFSIYTKTNGEKSQNFTYKTPTPEKLNEVFPRMDDIDVEELDFSNPAPKEDVPVDIPDEPMPFPSGNSTGVKEVVDMPVNDAEDPLQTAVGSDDDWD